MAIGTLTPFPTDAPQVGQTQEDFDANASGTLSHLNSNFVPEFNARVAEINTTATELNNISSTVQTSIDEAIGDVVTTITNARDETVTAKEDAEDAATVAQSSSNYKGDWVAGYSTTGYSLGMSVTYTDGMNYVSKIDNNLIEPTESTDTIEWHYVVTCGGGGVAGEINFDLGNSSTEFSVSDLIIDGGASI